MIGSKAFSQTNDQIIQEKSSEWIKVTSPVSVSKPKSTTTVKRKTSSKRSATPKQDTQEEFDKTNSQVNRFKKVKKD